MPVVVVASFTAKPESVEAVRAACIRAIETVHDEPGCQLYSLHETGDTFVFIEQWADADALKTHGTAPAIGVLFATGHRTAEAVVGHDFGASVAAYAALVRPDIFKRMVLMSGPFTGPPPLASDARTPIAPWVARPFVVSWVATSPAMADCSSSPGTRSLGSWAAAEWASFMRRCRPLSIAASR